MLDIYIMYILLFILGGISYKLLKDYKRDLDNYYFNMRLDNLQKPHVFRKYLGFLLIVVALYPLGNIFLYHVLS
jgi:hypothetical protein